MCAAALLAALGAGCAGESAPEADPACGPDVPLESWETFGQGFLSTYCQGCHASESADRHGAPPNVVFDTAADSETWRDQILDAVTSDPPRMPPAGGVPDDERERLRIWLTCFAGE